MMAKRKYFAFLSLALACAMVLGSAPAPAAAVEETSENAELTIVREDTSLRREYEKHFLMSDGSYQAVVYDEPVHQLVDGVWEEIDNTLTLTADGYATASGLADVAFAQSSGDNKLVTLTQNGYTISWNVRTVSGDLSVMSATSRPQTAAQAEVMPLNLSGISEEEQKTLALKSTSTVQYANALDTGVDLKYTVLPSRVKEDIILRSPSDISAYVMNITAEGLTAQLLDNREVEFADEDGEAIFTLHAPYMYDEAGELSQNIAVHLADRGSGNYVLTMTPDAQWLNDPTRVYPVTVDPSVTTRTEKSNILDNYVLQGSGVQDNNLDRLYFGNKSGSVARAYIKFQAMPYIPTARYIDSATLRLRVTNGTSTTNNINVYLVTTGDWSPKTIQWSGRPGTDTIVAKSVAAKMDSNGKYSVCQRTPVFLSRKQGF